MCEEQRSNFIVVPQYPPTLFFDIDFSQWNLGSSIWLGWLASQPQWSSILHLPSTGIRNIYHHFQLFIWILRIQFRSLCLQGNYFTNYLTTLTKKFVRFLKIRIYFLSIGQIFFTIVSLSQEVLLPGWFPLTYTVWYWLFSQSLNNIDFLQVSEHFSMVSYERKYSRMQFSSPSVLSNLGFLMLVLHDLAPITLLHMKLIHCSVNLSFGKK